MKKVCRMKSMKQFFFLRKIRYNPHCPFYVSPFLALKTKAFCHELIENVSKVIFWHCDFQFDGRQLYHTVDTSLVTHFYCPKFVRGKFAVSFKGTSMFSWPNRNIEKLSRMDNMSVYLLIIVICFTNGSS